MAEPKRAQNEAGVSVRVLSAPLVLAMAAVVLHQLSLLVPTTRFAGLNWELLLGALLFGFVSGTVAIRGFPPPGMFALIPFFGRAMAGNKSREG